MKRTPMTAKGAERLRAEVERLKSVERPRIILRLRKHARTAISRRMPNTTPRAISRVLSKAASRSSKPR